MLPIIGTSSYIQAPLKSRNTEAVVRVSAADSEPLAGEWQRAKKDNEGENYRVYDGELFIDEQAVGDYLAAAGMRQTIQPGLIISVRA